MVRESVFDRSKPLFDAVAPLSKLVEEAPEGDHEHSLVPGNLLDVLAG